MKKVLMSLVLVLVMVISCMSAWADVDLTGMSLDELKALQEQVATAIQAAENGEVSGEKSDDMADEATSAETLDDSGYEPLEKGAQGDAVKALQQRLFDLGFYNIAIDGDYGNGTVKALQAFEEYNGLESTGVASAQLQALLFSDQAKAKPIDVASIKMEKNPTLLVGGMLDMSTVATVSPENATEKGLSFTIDGEEFASIDDKGVLTGKSRGTVTVAATSLEQVEKPKTAKVKVKVIQPVQSITLEESFNGGNGDTRKLEPVVGPEDADDKGLEWISENPEIATVSSAGSVKGVGTGTTTITCTAKDGSGVSASTEVTVITAVKKVTISEKSITLIDDDSKRITAEVSPENATDTKVTWSSSDTSVATVDASGNITAKSAGTAEIIAEAHDGTGASAKVTVYVEPHLPLMVNSLSWQTTWGMKNGKMGVEVESFCTNKTIKSFDYIVVCSNLYGNSATSYLSYEGPSIKPGGTAKSKLTKGSVSGFTNAYTVEITPYHVYFTDGTEADIPSSYQYTSTFTM